MLKALCLLLALQLLVASETNETSKIEQTSTPAREMQQQCIDGLNGCTTCSSDGTICVTCDSLFDLSSTGVCVYRQSCGYSTYFDPDQGVCMSCSNKFSSCEACTSKSCSVCNIGYYLDTTSQQCSRCNSGCGDCTSWDKCIRCMEPYSMPYWDGSCPTNNLGTFYNPSTGLVEFCSRGCKTCDANTCTACWGWDAVVSGKECYCQNQWWESWNYIATGTYRSCHYLTVPEGCGDYSYDSLDPWGDVLCKTCKVGYYKEGHQCFACGSGCQECSDRYTCNSCIDQTNSYISGNQCICNDSHSYFNVTNRICMSCPDECSSCTDYQHCNSCRGYSFWHNNVCKCDDGMFFDVAILECKSCSPGCLHCTSAIGCSRCSPNYYLYDNSGVLACRACSGSCSNCGNNDECYQCGTSVELDNSQCTENTNLGYKIRYQDSGLLILDFPYSLPYYLSLKEVIVKTHGFYDTTSWWMERVTDKQYRVHTNLSRSNLPIDVRFKFNRN